MLVKEVLDICLEYAVLDCTFYWIWNNVVYQISVADKALILLPNGVVLALPLSIYEINNDTKLWHIYTLSAAISERQLYRGKWHRYVDGIIMN